MKNKTNNFIFDTVVSKLAALGTRQGVAAKKACDVISSVLREFGITYKTETYRVELPVWKKCVLRADRKNIPCMPTGFTSGTFDEVTAYTSSLVSSRYFLDVPHINFNPRSKAISRANFSFAPSCAVAAGSLPALFKARNLKGELKVLKKVQTTYQILVGNRRNPKTIVFSHVDSVGPGAIDNASGTALMLQAIIDKPKRLEETLFVFDGNEEMSYDYPTYWGKGYRNFEKKYPRLMLAARHIVVVDCIGYAPTEILKKGPIIKLAFPIAGIQKLQSKISLITSDYDALMPVYHSAGDVPSNIRRRFVLEALEKLDVYF
jgi:hypothetical protein